MVRVSKGANKENVASSVESEGDNEESEKNFNLHTKRTKMSKGEKKTRKLMSSLGLTPVPDVYKIVIRKTSQMTFAIVNSDVYKIDGTNAYVIFGDVKTEDFLNPINNLLTDKLKNSKMDVDAIATAAASIVGDTVGKTKSRSKVTDLDQEQEIDKIKEFSTSPKKFEVLNEPPLKDTSDIQVKPDDVKLVMGQTNCTEEQAITHLKKNNNDIVQTIIELSN